MRLPHPLHAALPPPGPVCSALLLHLVQVPGDHEGEPGGLIFILGLGPDPHKGLYGPHMDQKAFLTQAGDQTITHKEE